MSSLAVGGLVPVNGPLPRERMHSLLTVPGVVVPSGELEDHWQGGIAVYGYPDSVPELWEGCSDGTFRTKGEGGEVPQAVFTSFVMYVAISCSAMGIGSPEEFARRAELVLEATQAFGVERALAQGIVGLDNPYLGDANLDILAGGVAVSAGIALSYLEEAIGETGRAGIIHLTPAVASALQAIPTGDEGAVSPIFTAAGTSIAIGAGYQDTDPDSGATPGTTEDWVFASGPVHVRIDDVVELVPEDFASSLDRTVNDVIYRAEKVAVVSWDTSLQAGVLVDWAV